MPTAYTALIADGISFREFALQCSRQFGAMVTLRDSPEGEIPEKFETDSYHLRRVRELEEKLEKVLKLTNDEVEAEILKEEQQEEEYVASKRKEMAELKAKYQSMFLDVESWNPPTAKHMKLKDFMRQQIKESLDWDCDEKFLNNYKKPTRPTVLDWRVTQLNNLTDSILAQKEEHQKEVERVEQRNNWLKALRDSLPSEEITDAKVS